MTSLTTRIQTGGCERVKFDSRLTHFLVVARRERFGTKHPVGQFYTTTEKLSLPTYAKDLRPVGYPIFQNTQVMSEIFCIESPKVSDSVLNHTQLIRDRAESYNCRKTWHQTALILSNFTLRGDQSSQEVASRTEHMHSQLR